MQNSTFTIVLESRISARTAGGSAHRVPDLGSAIFLCETVEAGSRTQKNLLHKDSTSSDSWIKDRKQEYFYT
jgi:hypothetical protein